jgi:hypothetical protein
VNAARTRFVRTAAASPIHKSKLQVGQQTLEPACMPTSFHADSHRQAREFSAHSRTLLGLLAVPEPAFQQFPGLGIPATRFCWKPRGPPDALCHQLYAAHTSRCYRVAELRSLEWSVLGICDQTYQLVCMLNAARNQAPNVAIRDSRYRCTGVCNPQFHSLGISRFHSWKFSASKMRLLLSTPGSVGVPRSTEREVSFIR